MKDTDEIKLTVVVLVYNTAEFLHQCFDSLINQSLKNIEIIAVNDESPDNSLEICREYEAKHSNFRVISQKNQGGAVAGTTGMKEAKGKYISLIDSDDFLPLNAYKLLYNMCEFNNADIAIGKPLRYMNGKMLEVILPEEQAVWEEKKVITSINEVKTLFHDKFYWNKMFKREFIEKFEIYMPPGYLYADFLMTHKAYEFANKIAITNEIVYYWRRDDSSRVVKSASQEIASCVNFRERTKSLLFEQSNNLDIKHAFDDIKLLLLSFVFKDVIVNKTFRKTFIEESKKVLQTIDNIAQHKVHPIFKLHLWLLKENRLDDFFYIMGAPKPIKLISKNGKVYCNLPFFGNESINIPDEVYEYKMFRKEFIKNFLYIDNGETFTFQVLLHHIQCLPKSDYYLFFKSIDGTTKFKYKLKSNGDYFTIDVEKNILFENYERYFLGIGNNDNIVYRLKPNNCESSFDTRKKLTYVCRFSGNKKELFFEKRNLIDTIQRKIKK